jgi:hypothetical protein
MSDRVAAAARIMDAFGTRTGLTSEVIPRRYLWTDAFAVRNCIALQHVTGDASWLERARALIEQVHHVLGRHRADDARIGWISGLSDTEGEQHPTAGGLRIGKPLPERAPDEPPDERTDWDRDGQYYHYLTRWMEALERAAIATGEEEYARYGAELARAAHAAFAHERNGVKRLYWKMSIDLSQPAVTSMGDHDALDGLVATSVIDARVRAAGLDIDLGGARDELAQMCHDRGWATTDALGIGGLLASALGLTRIDGDVDVLLARVLHDAARSLDLLMMRRPFDAPAAHRLAFRELGLSIGLAAVDRMRMMRKHGELRGGEVAAVAIEKLHRQRALRDAIELFWMDPLNQQAETWTEHEDINAVMLASSLLADVERF